MQYQYTILILIKLDGIQKYKNNEKKNIYIYVCNRHGRKSTIKSEEVTDLWLPTVTEGMVIEGFTTGSSTEVSQSSSSASSSDDDDDAGSNNASSGSTSSEVRLDSTFFYYFFVLFIVFHIIIVIFFLKSEY